MATTNLALPTTQKITLAPGVEQIIAGMDNGKITVHIPTGSTVSVKTTCAIDPDVQGNDASIWVDWPAGAKAGPYMDVLLGTVSALKLVSVAGGVVYLSRSKTLA